MTWTFFILFLAGRIRLSSPSSVEPCRGRFPYMVIALFVFMAGSCAKQGFPPGGPRDEMPPFLERTTPSALAINVSKTGPVVFEFSEPMDTKSVEDNLFIIPIPSTRPEFEWKSKGRKLMLSFARPLRDNTTYVISIGTKARDLKSNELDDSIMLSFSTGESVENGKLTGNVIPCSFFDEKSENVSGIDVVAYHVDEASPPPDPRHDVPDYVTQSGSGGTYELVGLSTGVYRIFAIGDRDRDGFYSEGYDLIGIAPHDVILAEGDSVAFAPDIAISARDTSCVQLLSIKAPDNRRVELYFDRVIEPDSLHVEFNGLNSIDRFVPEDNSVMISTATEKQEDGTRYTVKALRVFDRDGNMYHPLGITPFFSGTDRPDTTALEVMVWRPKILSPGDEYVTVVFNRVLDLPENPEEVLLPETSKEMSVIRSGPNQLELVPKQEWRENVNYQVFFDCEKLLGVAGNRLNGTGSQLEFRVVSSDTLGFITGAIEDYAETTGTLYRLNFKNIDTDTMKELEIESTREWSTGPVLPGRYLCRAYRDDDRDGELFRGSIYPYRSAEQAVAYPDTIVVISRWTNEDIVFIFR